MISLVVEVKNSSKLFEFVLRLFLFSVGFVKKSPKASKFELVLGLLTVFEGGALSAKELLQKSRLFELLFFD